MPTEGIVAGKHFEVAAKFVALHIVFTNKPDPQSGDPLDIISWSDYNDAISVFLSTEWVINSIFIHLLSIMCTWILFFSKCLWMPKYRNQITMRHSYWIRRTELDLRI